MIMGLWVDCRFVTLQISLAPSIWLCMWGADCSLTSDLRKSPWPRCLVVGKYKYVSEGRFCL